MNGNDAVVYLVNARDQLVSVNESWNRFAAANSAEQLVGERVLGSSLWGFIHDVTTRDLYRRILLAVRSGQSVTFNIRCDSPARRRWLRMAVRQREAAMVEFRTETLREEDCPPFSAAEQSTAAVLTSMCSWCARILVVERWMELASALPHSALFDQSHPPLITHGICDECLQLMEEELQLLLAK